MLGIRSAPGLLSRRTVAALGAVPDVLEGEVYLKALGKSTRYSFVLESMMASCT